MSEIIFYNSGNGDIHYSRQFIKDIILKLGYSNEYYYAHNKSSNILCDISLKTIKLDKRFDFEKCITHCNGSIYINTWIGQEHGKYINKGQGITIDSNYKLFKSIFNELNIEIDENILNYIPTIDFNYVFKEEINKFILNNDKVKILICNGDVRSGQSKNFSFDDIIDYISDKYNDMLFILTNDTNLNKSNVLNTKNIIKKEDDCDLNEISYLSTFCDIIIGRSSGPYCFCDIYDNLMDDKKTFLNISIVNNWCEYNKCKLILTCDYDRVHKIIDNILENEKDN